MKTDGDALCKRWRALIVLAHDETKYSDMKSRVPRLGKGISSYPVQRWTIAPLQVPTFLEAV